MRPRNSQCWNGRQIGAVIEFNLYAEAQHADTSYRMSLSDALKKGYVGSVCLMLMVRSPRTARTNECTHACNGQHLLVLGWTEIDVRRYLVGLVALRHGFGLHVSRRCVDCCVESMFGDPSWVDLGRLQQWTLRHSLNYPRTVH